MVELKLTKPIEGQPPSAEIRQYLVDEGRPVLVAFSGGKDAIATELALRDAGVDTILAHLYAIPGRVPGEALGFVDDGLKRLEDLWQKPIHRYPHPSFYRLLNNLIFQPPERCEIIENAQIPTVTHLVMWDMIRRDLNLPDDTWSADGVRASDSLVRRASIKRHGAMKVKGYKVSPIYDWLQGDVHKYIEHHNVQLPVDYEMFGRSFDGLDIRFTGPIKERFPDDYARILDWFPLAELEIMRHEL